MVVYEDANGRYMRKDSGNEEKTLDMFSCLNFFFYFLRNMPCHADA
jgi:hypothetical protein